MKYSKLENRQRRTLFLIIMAVVLVLYSISLLFPLLWTVSSSIRLNRRFSADPMGLPSEFMFENYLELFTQFSISGILDNQGNTKSVYFLEMLYNSLFYCFGVSIVANTTRCLCAYVCARYRNVKFTKWIYNLVIVMMTISFPSNLAVTIEYYNLVGIYNNMYMAVFLSLSFQGANFLFLYAAFISLSKEYAEAAQLDGANQFQVMVQVMIPMVKNIFVALIMLEFITHWNDYQPNVIYLRAYPMLSYALFHFVESPKAVPAVQKLAGCFIVMIPTLVIFIIFKDRIMSNLSIGGLKG